jgi:aminomuconate-semialdehyde/2-hydroxymuconate-6-semialdehyde dehydrogenase
MKETLNFIEGRFVPTGKLFDNRCPVDNRVISRVHEAGRAEVDAAVAAITGALKHHLGARIRS